MNARNLFGIIFGAITIYLVSIPVWEWVDEHDWKNIDVFFLFMAITGISFFLPIAVLNFPQWRRCGKKEERPVLTGQEPDRKAFQLRIFKDAS